MKPSSLGSGSTRSFCILLAILLESLHANSHALLKAGVKPGINAGSVSVSQPKDITYSRLLGFSGGVDAEIAALPNIDFRTDVLYTRKGSEFASPYSNGGKMRLDEVVIAPFMVVSHPLGDLVPSVQAGPEFGWITLVQNIPVASSPPYELFMRYARSRTNCDVRKQLLRYLEWAK